jgi:hypothetical protein
MTTARRSGYSVGNTPPFVTWTVVRGDSASFRVYVTDDAKQPIDVSEWVIDMEIKRPDVAQTSPEITDDATAVLTITPAITDQDEDGEFTVTLLPNQSSQLETGDIFDIELSQSATSKVWTVAQGSMIILEDVTNS